jgi:site-specific DNA recombinase
MSRAAIYCRYSSDLQNDRSIEDQLAACRSYAERNGYTVVATYDDRAISGARFEDRQGLQRLLADAAKGRFDAVITESTSRMSRDQGDAHHIRKRLEFYDVKLVTPADGVVTAMTAGLRALMDEQYIIQLAAASKRGMAGKIDQGLSASGILYGYDAVPGEPGKRVINEFQAKVVRRIYKRYLDGASSKQIAAELNRDRIPPPKGKMWRSNTIMGNGPRGIGIIANETYAGTLVWNRTRKVRDPITRKRLSRPNPESEWKRTLVPHLAIIDRETFDAAQRRRRGSRAYPPRTSPRRPLSGLLRCGGCGCGMPSCGHKPGGSAYIKCAGVVQSGACDNTRTYPLLPIERRVVRALRSKLGTADLIAVFLDTYAAQRRQRGAADRVMIAKVEADLRSVEQEVERAVALATRGILREAEVRPRLDQLQADRDRLMAELAALRTTDDSMVPDADAVEDWVEHLSDLHDALVRHGDVPQVTTRFRQIVGRVTVMPAPARQDPEIVVAGDLGPLVQGFGLSGAG